MDLFLSILTDGTLAADVVDALNAADVPYDLTVTRTVPGTYDVETGTTGPATVTDYSCVGFVDVFDQRVVDGTLIQQSDRRVFIAASTLAITPTTTTDTVTIGSTDYVIVSVQQDPAAALWELQART